MGGKALFLHARTRCLRRGGAWNPLVTMAKNGNKALGDAKKQKKDEFYTQLSDINNELRHYMQHFAGKVVFCNCDDPYESNFFKYFAANFNALKLKRLIATCYAGSSVAGRQLDLFGDTKETESTRKRIPHKIVINEVTDVNGDGRIDLADVEWLIKNDRNVLSRLTGDGDFRSAECVELLKESDVVVTNPPFSLFREYIAQLVQYGKKFLVIGPKSALHYKEVFPLIQQNRIWVGHTPMSRDLLFEWPEAMQENAVSSGRKGSNFRMVGGRVLGRSPSIWFTNLDHRKRHDEYVFIRRYNPDEYPTYGNFDAIDVSKAVDIPEDWDGLMGVPDTFLDKYNPDQFEIVGIAEGDSGKQLGLKPVPMELKKINPSLRDGQFYLMKGGRPAKPYSRIIIRRRK